MFPFRFIVHAVLTKLLTVPNVVEKFMASVVVTVAIVVAVKRAAFRAYAGGL
jgi:hypothetical protein